MKIQTRKMMIKNRDEMSPLERENLSKKILDNIIQWEVFQGAKRIMTYHSFRSEVDTIQLIKYSLNSSKEVILPKSIKDGFKILPCRIDSLDELEKSSYGILEPLEEKVVDRDSIDLIIVPGVAFDREGFRLGYGAGFYDRFLEEYKGITAGVCFSSQIIEDVYKDEHDARMDYLITEMGITKTGD